MPHTHLGAPRRVTIAAAALWLVGVFGPWTPATARAQPAAPQAPATGPAARPADVASMDAILAALYDAISGPSGAPRDWDRFRSLFVAGARLMPIAHPAGAAAQARVLTPDDYVARVTPMFEQAGFFEREVARRVETYGSLTHAWSTYESRRTREDAAPFASGINSIQLLNDGARWWIVSVLWEPERPDVPLPAIYLPR
jgi:hypothetical protein